MEEERKGEDRWVGKMGDKFNQFVTTSVNDARRPLLCRLSTVKLDNSVPRVTNERNDPSLKIGDDIVDTIGRVLSNLARIDRILFPVTSNAESKRVALRNVGRG